VGKVFSIYEPYSKGTRNAKYEAGKAPTKWKFMYLEERQ
jgi:hypothetical protein